jgi:hypothetical protein
MAAVRIFIIDILLVCWRIANRSETPGFFGGEGKPWRLAPRLDQPI